MPAAILDNPFRVLGAAAADDAHRLIALADEASLLGEPGAQAALDALMHSHSRLDAEIRWFPGAPAERVQSFLQRARGEENCPLPALDDLPPLAQLNAIRLLLEAWPVFEAQSAAALCRAAASADCRISMPLLMAQLNADRAAAGMQLLTDPAQLADRLNALRSETAARLYERIRALPPHIADEAMVRAAQSYTQLRSPLLETLVSLHALKTRDEAAQLSQRILELCATSKDPEESVRSKGLREAGEQLARWDAITRPERVLLVAKGHTADGLFALYKAVIDASVIAFNQYRMSQIAYDMTRQMYEVFFDLPLEHDLLKSNLAIIAARMKGVPPN